MSRFTLIHGGRSSPQAPNIRVSLYLWRVMLQLLENELNSSDFEQLQAHHPELRGFTMVEVETFIRESRQRTGDL